MAAVAATTVPENSGISHPPRRGVAGDGAAAGALGAAALAPRTASVKDRVGQVGNVGAPGPVDEGRTALEGSHEAGILVDLRAHIADSVVDGSIGGCTVVVETLVGLADEVVAAAAVRGAVRVRSRKTWLDP